MKVKGKAKWCRGTSKSILDTKQDSGLGYQGIDGMGIRPTNIKRIRMKCPKCGKRMMSSVSVCHDGCCLYHSLPRHKVKAKSRKTHRRK